MLIRAQIFILTMSALIGLSANAYTCEVDVSSDSIISESSKALYAVLDRSDSPYENGLFLKEFNGTPKVCKGNYNHPRELVVEYSKVRVQDLIDGQIMDGKCYVTLWNNGSDTDADWSWTYLLCEEFDIEVENN